MAVILGRVAGVPPVRRGALRWTDSVCCRAQGRLLSFSVSIVELYQIVAPLENKGVEAVKYTKVVHFSELKKPLHVSSAIQ